MTDPSGKIVGRKFNMRARPEVEYLFRDLYPALNEYLEAVVAMLQKLNGITISLAITNVQATHPTNVSNLLKSSVTGQGQLPSSWYPLGIH